MSSSAQAQQPLPLGWGWARKSREDAATGRTALCHRPFLIVLAQPVGTSPDSDGPLPHQLSVACTWPASAFHWHRNLSTGGVDGGASRGTYSPYQSAKPHPLSARAQSPGSGAPTRSHRSTPLGLTAVNSHALGTPSARLTSSGDVRSGAHAQVAAAGDATASWPRSTFAP